MGLPNIKLEIAFQRPNWVMGMALARPPSECNTSLGHSDKRDPICGWRRDTE